MARPTPVLPEVGSTTVPPGARRPSASASSSIFRAIRSFTEPPGFRYSSLTSTVARIPSVTRFNRTRGVFPISPSTFSAYCIWCCSGPGWAAGVWGASFVMAPTVPATPDTAAVPGHSRSRSSAQRGILSAARETIMR